MGDEEGWRLRPRARVLQHHPYLVEALLTDLHRRPEGEPAVLQRHRHCYEAAL